jgi:hypothetical protein
MTKLLLILLLTSQAFAGGGSRPVPIATPSPSPVVSGTPMADCAALGKLYVRLDPKASVEKVFAEQTLCYLNQVHANGCLERGVKASTFKTFERDPMPQVKDASAAWALYTASLPLAVDLRWYRTSNPWSGTLGYTYFYRDNVDGAPSETRIWTNSRKGWTAKEYASHIAHELAHQARNGGFGHWTQHDGSFPYVVGDRAAECIAKL